MNEPVTDAPCPCCKGVHYSFYNAERCKARYDIETGLATYAEQQREKQKRVVRKRQKLAENSVDTPATTTTPP